LRSYLDLFLTTPTLRIPIQALNGIDVWSEILDKHQHLISTSTTLHRYCIDIE